MASKTKPRSPEPLCCNPHTGDCFAKKNLRCTVLRDTHFKKGICSFYKPETEKNTKPEV